MTRSVSANNVAKLRGIINASDYGFATSASAAVNASAIQAAYDALGGTYGGTVLLPEGQFNVAPDVIKPVTRNVSLRGMGPGMSYDGASRARTSLIFTGGTIAIDFTTWSGGSSGGFYELRDVNIDGSDTTDYGIKANGQVLCDNFTINNCELANIYLFNFINTARLQNFSLGGSAGVGLLIGDASGGSNTSFSCENFSIRQNVTGIKIVNGRSFSFRNGTVESNTGAGLHIYQPTGGQVNMGEFDHVWFEENRYTGGAGYQIVIEAQTPTDRPGEIDFDHCTIEATAPTDAVDVINGEYVRLIDCDFTSGADVQFRADTYRCAYINHTGAKHIEGALTDVGSENYQGLIDESGFQYAANATPTFTATLTGCTTAPTYSVKYVKTGLVVTIEVPEIAGTSNATTKTLTGMPASIQPSSTKQGLWCSAVVDNGGGAVPGAVRISGGIIHYFANSNTAAFTASGAFAASQISITYTLA